MMAAPPTTKNSGEKIIELRTQPRSATDAWRLLYIWETDFGYIIEYRDREQGENKKTTIDSAYIYNIPDLISQTASFQTTHSRPREETVETVGKILEWAGKDRGKPYGAGVTTKYMIHLDEHVIPSDTPLRFIGEEIMCMHTQPYRYSDIYRTIRIYLGDFGFVVEYENKPDEFEPASVRASYAHGLAGLIERTVFFQIMNGRPPNETDAAVGQILDWDDGDIIHHERETEGRRNNETSPQ